MKHVHRYIRRDISQTPKKKYIVLACSLPHRNHYINPKLAVGKLSICWRCGEEFIITPDLLRLAKPHCKDCTKTKGPEVDSSLLESIMRGL